LINPGALKDKVDVQELTQAAGASGSVVETYTTVFNRYAQIRPVRGREPYINDQRLGEIDLVVVMRYDSKTKAITPKHQLLYKGRILEIDSAINVEMKDQEVRIYCREIL